MEKSTITPGNILSGSFFGNLLTALCFGVLTIQASSYYRAFPNDGKPVKLAVGLLWSFEAFQLACITRSSYWWFVANFHNHFTSGRATWEFLIFQINTVCSSFTVQTFFAYRIYSLSGNLYMGVLVQVLVLLQFGFGVGTSVKANMTLDFQAMVKECTWLVVAWLTIQAIADIVIATFMCLSLRRRRTGFYKTDSVINRMVLYTIGTGLITSVLSCFLLVIFAKYGFHISELTLGMPLGTCYSITMLANLHMRTTLRARFTTSSPVELLRIVDHGSVRRSAYIVTS
ncbi:hypothetical protein BS47DRAFT_1205204 [Hydnum rufescens UP504]|uniref:DUF6534 domain-containing protein n=1 Tax=Hydnum rufescens UP504 TaxID=1448309 RepID=A0A9P6DU00_9AGAM|nr:hypothetical protein BS47DRAFT_1205204 [Hydnum rufescens UP504]